MAELTIVQSVLSLHRFLAGEPWLSSVGFTSNTDEHGLRVGVKPDWNGPEPLVPREWDGLVVRIERNGKDFPKGD